MDIIVCLYIYINASVICMHIYSYVIYMSPIYVYMSYICVCMCFYIYIYIWLDGTVFQDPPRSTVSLSSSRTSVWEINMMKCCRANPVISWRKLSPNTCCLCWGLGLMSLRSSGHRLSHLKALSVSQQLCMSAINSSRNCFKVKDRLTHRWDCRHKRVILMFKCYYQSEVDEFHCNNRSHVLAGSREPWECALCLPGKLEFLKSPYAIFELQKWDKRNKFSGEILIMDI